ncbi:hypothetical protein AAC387_Pa06g1855 [Persea americana]
MRQSDLFGVNNAKCEAAFQDIKSYLTKPPMLVVPTTGKPFILYTRALDYSLGALLAQENDGGKEAALYYLSRMLVGAEHHYFPVEKECLAVMFAIQKPRHYLLSNTVYLDIDDQSLKAEYQALIIGLELALESGITMLEAFGDSQLIVNQMNQEYEIRKPDLLPYYNKAQSLR